jgi:hypothetical protein
LARDARGVTTPLPGPSLFCNGRNGFRLSRDFKRLALPAGKQPRPRFSGPKDQPEPVTGQQISGSQSGAMSPAMGKSRIFANCRISD